MPAPAPPTNSNWLEEHPRLSITVIVSVIIILLILLGEFVLRSFLGLGNPVLYRSSPLFGYRPQLNQLVHRLQGAEIKINNLGLRADRDWDEKRENKVLFLGNSVTYGGSYIGTRELFSHLAVGTSGDYLGGNAGVNGWGIGNIHALVVQYKFNPASVYVSVLQEMDFYRGLSKLAGKPFWAHKPASAWQELIFHLFYGQLLKIYRGHDRFVSDLELDLTVENSVRKLKELDDYLKSKGFVHLIYMSPNSDQVLRNAPIDERVQRYLEKYQVQVDYLLYRPEIQQLSREEKAAIYYDWSHLSKKGHQLWGEMIHHDLENRLLLTDRSKKSAN